MIDGGNQPLFSVIIPTYNREATLATTLASVREQRYRSFEIIVGDDGSSDATVEIAEATPGVRVLRQKNAGPGAARNLAAKEATGRYLALIDSDDAWFPWTLETYVELLQAHAEPALLFGRVARFTIDEELADLRAEHGATPVRSRRFDDFFAGNGAADMMPSSCLAVVRRDAFEQVGGFTSARVSAEDIDLFLRLGDAGPLVQVDDKPTVAFRRHAGQSISQLQTYVDGCRLLLDGERDGRYPGGTARRTERRAWLAATARRISRECAERGRPAAALEIYRRTLTWNLTTGRGRFLTLLPVIALLHQLRRLLPGVRAVPPSR
jgi:cellulose synthase/poly-beta-1,6-N-acetylglucosamine synthase-like glycosyltransferase